MSLGEHIAELRTRLLWSVLGIVAGTVAGWFLYEWLLQILTDPFQTSIADYARRRGLEPQLTMTGVADPLTFRMKISFVFGVVLASPVWLYQLWAFIAPGLHRHEKKWAYLFSAAATPMFMVGIAVAYWTMPKALQILIGFTPEGVENLIALPHYLDFTLRTMLLFGVSFQMPLIVMFLAWRGLVSGRSLKRARSYVVVGLFIFAAIATPSGDPITMSMLAVPMSLLYLAAEGLAAIVARRQAAAERAESAERPRPEPAVARGDQPRAEQPEDRPADYATGDWT